MRSVSLLDQDEIIAFRVEGVWVVSQESLDRVAAVRLKRALICIVPQRGMLMQTISLSPVRVCASSTLNCVSCMYVHVQRVSMSQCVPRGSCLSTIYIHNDFVYSHSRVMLSILQIVSEEARNKHTESYGVCIYIINREECLFIPKCIIIINY